jgi:hypothetical protein
VDLIRLDFEEQHIFGDPNSSGVRFEEEPKSGLLGPEMSQFSEDIKFNVTRQLSMHLPLHTVKEIASSCANSSNSAAVSQVSHSLDSAR